MDGSYRIWIGGALIAAGIIGLITAKRHRVLAYLLCLAWVALGVGILLKLWPTNMAWAASAVAIGWGTLEAARRRKWDQAWTFGWMTVVNIGFLGEDYIPQLRSLSVLGTIAIGAFGVWRFFSTPDTRMATDDAEPNDDNQSDAVE